MALMGSSTAERKTISEHTMDKDYDLVSVLYHSLQGVEAAAKYEQDATSENSPEIASFMREVQDANNRLAKKAKGLLLKQKQV